MKYNIFELSLDENYFQAHALDLVQSVSGHCVREPARPGNQRTEIPNYSLAYQNISVLPLVVISKVLCGPFLRYQQHFLQWLVAQVTRT